MAHDRTPNNDTALGNGVLKAFFYVGDYCFITSTTTAGVYQTLKTNDASSWTATSIRETVKFTPWGSGLTKELVGVTVETEYLPSGATVVLKYKKDEETSWTQIFSHAVADSLEHSTGIIESTGANLPQYREIQFRIESTAGAEITGLKFKSQIIDTEPYG